MQQRVFDYSSAENRLGELTTARDTAGRAVDDATRALKDAEETVKIADASDQLVQVGRVRAKSVDTGAELRTAFVFGLIVCALAFGLALFLRRRAARAELQFAGAGAPGVTIAPHAARGARTRTRVTPRTRAAPRT